MKTDNLFRYLPDKRNAKKLLEISASYTMFQGLREPHYGFDGEYHTPWEIVYVLDGHVSATADDRVYTLRKGDMIIHEPMEFHRLFTEEESARLFIFTFDMAGEATDKLHDLVLHLSAKQKARLDTILRDIFASVPPDAATSTDRQGGENIDYWANTPDDIFQLALKNIEGFLLGIAFDDRSGPQSTAYSENANLYTNIVTLLQDNVCGNISITDIAEKCGVSGTTVKNCFSHYAGCGIHKYFLKLKMRRAMELLADGYSVAAVSDMLGFSSANYFSSVFRRETGKVARSCK